MRQSSLSTFGYAARTEWSSRDGCRGARPSTRCRQPLSVPVELCICNKTASRPCASRLTSSWSGPSYGVACAPHVRHFIVHMRRAGHVVTRPLNCGVRAALPETPHYMGATMDNSQTLWRERWNSYLHSTLYCGVREGSAFSSSHSHGRPLVNGRLGLGALEGTADNRTTSPLGRRRLILDAEALGREFQRPPLLKFGRCATSHGHLMTVARPQTRFEPSA